MEKRCKSCYMLDPNIFGYCDSICWETNNNNTSWPRVGYKWSFDGKIVVEREFEKTLLDKEVEKKAVEKV